ncbi:PREDICTED: filament-like plant protein [Nicotiana attenuata]|uniref:filament-like plant protein n=1 Tax=Nicotiana attenuata TaxID=49451 RepID=UPI0009052FCF|nr:PREDICTED: filament-like plant protein [Nicotiana attenuata]
MDEVETPCLFSEARQALNRASVLHHEGFLQFRGELSRYEAEIRGIIEEKDAFKLLSEQREGEAKGLHAELKMTQKEHAELVEQVRRIFEVSDGDSGMVANGLNSQVQQNLDVIRQLREEVDAIKIEAEGWKKKMDRLASAENQLRGMKEEILENLVAELKAAKSEVKTAKADADVVVAIYRADAEAEAAPIRAKEVAEAAQVRVKGVAEKAKYQSRKETLEEIHAQGFDLTTEIENARELEAEARKLAFPMIMMNLGA